MSTLMASSPTSSKISANRREAAESLALLAAVSGAPDPTSTGPAACQQGSADSPDGGPTKPVKGDCKKDQPS